MGEISREMSVHFYHKFIKGVTHADVVDSLKDIEMETSVISIQITEERCVITCKDIETKHALMVKGLDIKNRNVQLLDVEKTVTNVTIKDAPYELRDEVIVTFMSQFGQVVPSSVKRGTIKGTEIENGTRYLNIIGCAPTLPLRAKIGRFDIRIFANNKRTPCFRCGESDHPSYKCPRVGMKVCHVCKGTDHLAKECPEKRQLICYYCNESGHIQRNCPMRDVDVYGEYAAEVREGREANDAESTENNVTPQKPEKVNEKMVKTAVVLGASNVRRLNINDDESIVDASISGATLHNIRQTIDKALDEIEKNESNIEKVIVSLGTNDVSQNKLDSEQVILNFTAAINEVKAEFPNAEIGVCGIIPRKGRNERVKNFNSVAESVNRFALKMCAKDDACTYIDTPAAFTRQGKIASEFYDPNDQSGLHVSKTGAEKLKDKFYEFY
ncbi:hypothetical protein FSP39_000185 [Pinctada imbricata]|uniref:CCHC-type domain-containing protein n=1 Tax=Pinctada imbricata TaxID=66713 RepID=A0AA88XE77_PINIB|nr:hypothetical protein FSP39_000185 [Pinctada imbricata]